MTARLEGRIRVTRERDWRSGAVLGWTWRIQLVAPHGVCANVRPKIGTGPYTSPQGALRAARRVARRLENADRIEVEG